MFLRFFNIALIAAYFFCGYAQITGTRYINGLNGIVFTESKNTNPVRTQFFSAALAKHIHSFNQIGFGDHAKDSWVHFIINRPLIALYFIPSENDLLKILLDSPLNKAPPFSSL